MQKILFVCHGNICRSTMAEYVMKDMVAKLGLSDQYEIDSAATSREDRSMARSEYRSARLNPFCFFTPDAPAFPIFPLLVIYVLGTAAPDALAQERRCSSGPSQAAFHRALSDRRPPRRWTGPWSLDRACVLHGGAHR